jgi:thiol-disulfide isomerase/thioredoxin
LRGNCAAGGFFSAAAAVLILMLSIAAAEPPQTLTPLAVIKIAPDITLDIADGVKLKLSDLRGKVVVINFWASWCTPCRREMPSLERLKGLMKGERFEIVAVNAGEDEDEIAEFRGDIKPVLTFRFALDRNAYAMKAFSIAGLPTTYVIDRQGRVVYRAVGGRLFDDPEIVGMLKALTAR